jgi:hypothetical protein
MSSPLPPPHLPGATSTAPGPRLPAAPPKAPAPRPSTAAPTAPAPRPSTAAPTAPVPGTTDPATILEGDTASLNDIYGAANYWQRSTTAAAKGARGAAPGELPCWRQNPDPCSGTLTCGQLQGRAICPVKRFQERRARVRVERRFKVGDPSVSSSAPAFVGIGEKMFLTDLLGVSVRRSDDGFGRWHGKGYGNGVCGAKSEIRAVELREVGGNCGL